MPYDSDTPEQASTVPDDPGAISNTGSLKVLGRYTPYSQLGRVGLILPSPNTVVEAEFNRLTCDGLTFHGARTPVSGTPSMDSLHAMAEGTERAARDLRTAECDAVLYACTSGSFMVDREETKARMSKMAGCPVTTTSDAVLAALQALGVKKVSLATPYRRFLTEGEVEWLNAEGYEVVAYDDLNMGDDERERWAINRVPPEVAYRLGRQVVRDDTEVIFLSCTAMASLPIIEALERDTGLPVITSNLSSFWHLTKILGIRVEPRIESRLLSL